MCNNLNNALLPHFYVLLWLGRVYTKRGSWVAAKHTTNKQYSKTNVFVS